MSGLQLVQILQKMTQSYKKRVFTLREMAALLETSTASAGMTLLRAKNKGLVGHASGLWINLLDPPQLSEVAFQILSPAYISFESALYHHGILSQAPKGRLTLATLGRPRLIKTPLGLIQFIHLKPSLFFGFDTKRMAAPEKAWLDLVYLRGLKGRKNIIKEEFYLEELDKKKIRKWASYYPAWVMN